MRSVHQLTELIFDGSGMDFMEEGGMEDCSINKSFEIEKVMTKIYISNISYDPVHLLRGYE